MWFYPANRMCYPLVDFDPYSQCPSHAVKYRTIEDSVCMASTVSSALRRVLVLGSGFTSAPLVECLTREGRIAVTVASNILEQAQQLSTRYQNTTATTTTVDVTSEENLSSLIRGHELVVSYVPNTLHPVVAKQCVAHKVNMVTASYVSPALKALHEPAVKAGVTLLNEVGLDPGIDHMLAAQCFDEVHSKGGKVVSFESWCGGLPHPDCADNPLKYKFSWSPRGVLLAAHSSAKYIKDGKLCEIAEGGVMEPENMRTFKGLLPGTAMEGYFNRDSTKYVDIYNIQHATTVIRGTLRYKGFCSVLLALERLGLLNHSQFQRLNPGAADIRWKDLVAMLIAQSDIRESSVESSVYRAVEENEQTMKAIQELGLLSDELVDLAGSPLDALCSHLQKKLQYKPGERDAIYLHHFIGIEWPDKKRETRHIDLTLYGEANGFTAMARTVGWPTAIAAKMILSGELRTKGIVIPTTKDLYVPILEKLKEDGIEAKTVQLSGVMM